MSLADLRSRLLGRLTVRSRIALGCAGLFLVTGAAFVTATYVLVERNANSYPAALAQIKPFRVAEQTLLQGCVTAKASHIPPTPPEALACKQAVAGGVLFGAADQRTHDLHALLLWSLVGLGVATVVAGALGWAIGGRILIPLHRVTAAARRASQEHLDERIRLDGPRDELKDLADTFDDMLNRLDLAFASQRRFVANASHELRTPLTSMRTLLDVALAKPTRTVEQLETVIGRVREALDQSDAIMDGLLTLARSHRGLTSREPLDLEAAAQDAIDETTAAARAAHIAVQADLSPAPALGERVLVERLVANLVDNALRYNVSGGTVQVTTGTDHGQSYLSVGNSGPLVPPSMVASLFEPFTRMDQRIANGRGVGLGLSIVASVVAAHGGHLEANARPDGGLRITVAFPTAAALVAQPLTAERRPRARSPRPARPRL